MLEILMFNNVLRQGIVSLVVNRITEKSLMQEFFYAARGMPAAAAGHLSCWATTSEVQSVRMSLRSGLLNFLRRGLARFLKQLLVKESNVCEQSSRKRRQRFATHKNAPNNQLTMPP